MVSKDVQRAQAIELLSAHLLQTGLSQTSLRQLASAADVSDRMLLYYFENKGEVLSSTLAHIAGGLTKMLDTVVSSGAKVGPQELLIRTTALARDPATKSFFKLWIEIVAAAARGEEPYTSISNAIAEGFLVWIEERLDGGSPAQRKATAAMILAMIDGLALLDICTDDQRTESAAAQMTRLLHPDSPQS